MEKATNTGSVIATPDLREFARDVVTRLGLRRAATELGANHTAIAAAIAGIPVRRGTIATLTAAQRNAANSHNSEPPPAAA
jgi:hypothetical protein